MYMYQIMEDYKRRTDATHDSDGTTILGKTQVNPLILLSKTFTLLGLVILLSGGGRQGTADEPNYACTVGAGKAAGVPA